MTTSSGLDGVARVIVGVDTHLDEHVAVAIDHHGTRLGEYRLGTTANGYEDLERWSVGLGQIATFGVEGTRSYGARRLDTLLGVATRLSRSTDQTGPHAVDWAKATLSTLKWPHDLFSPGWLGSLPSQVWTRWR